MMMCLNGTEPAPNTQDMKTSVWDAVLFDLDGTLIDSAADLATAANRLRGARGLTALPLSAYRASVGSGARGMLNVAFGVTPEHADFSALKAEFFDAYEACLCEHTRLFDGVSELLARLHASRLSWGIVTNKIERFALPLLRQLSALSEACCVIGGDTTPYSKPHPQPLLEACARLDVVPQRCVYVGDDLRDVQAGRAAGMTTLAVSYGYLGEGQDPAQWGADAVVETPQALVQWLKLN